MKKLIRQSTSTQSYEAISGYIFHENGRATNNKGMDIHMDEEDEISLGACCLWCKERFFTKEKFRRRFPIVNWVPNYSLTDLRGDLIAGLSVAFTIVPQALALALLAGLPAQYGLHTSILGCFVYTLFGSCKDVAVGPTSILAILILPYVTMGGPAYAVMLSFYSGLVTLILGIFNIGFVVDFISYPVISSFSAAAAITIASSQLYGFTGISHLGSGVIGTLTNFFKRLNEMVISDTLMGLFCLSFLLPLQYFKDHSFTRGQSGRISKARIWANRIWRVVVMTRNAIVVIICGLIASQVGIFTTTPDIKTGLPDFQSPFLLNTTKDHVEIIQDIAPGVAVVSVVGLLETVAVAKAFTADKKFDATQEMIALGLCNIAGSFFSAFPATGSFSRSAVNNNSGVRTPLGGSITGALVVLALVTLAPFFEYIPKTALASIIIAAVLPMIKFQDIPNIWKANKIDIIPYALTLVAALLIRLEYGILFGLLFSLSILLYQMARPKITIAARFTPSGDVFLYVKPDRSVLFPSVEYLKVKISKSMDENDMSSGAIVIDGEHMFRADSTCAMSLKHMIRRFHNQGCTVIFYSLRKPLLRALRHFLSCPDEFIYCQTQDEVYNAIRSRAELKDRLSTLSHVSRDSRESNHWLTKSVDY